MQHGAKNYAHTPVRPARKEEVETSSAIQEGSRFRCRSFAATPTCCPMPHATIQHQDQGWVHLWNMEDVTDLNRGTRIHH